jgi:hypothetical protein
MWLPENASILLFNQAEHVHMAGGLLGAAGLLWLVFSLTCPRCHLRLFPHAISTQQAAGWLQWLLRASSCPRCGYEAEDN